MSPRVQLGGVPFAVQAPTVPDGSITKAKLNLNNGLTISGNQTVKGEIEGSYYCGGHTNTDGTGWVNFPEGKGIYRNFCAIDSQICVKLRKANAVL